MIHTRSVATSQRRRRLSRRGHAAVTPTSCGKE
jgi:hypothetical protein